MTLLRPWWHGLSYRQREIIKLRYGLDDSLRDATTYTQEEVAHIFKVSVARVRNIEQQAIKILSKYGITLPLAATLAGAPEKPADTD